LLAGVEGSNHDARDGGPEQADEAEGLMIGIVGQGARSVS